MGAAGASKPNIRSFRYSDRVAQILEAQPGDSLNAKFEALVLTCYDKLPEVERRLDRLNEQIEVSRKQLADMTAMERNCEQLQRSVDTLLFEYKQYAERYVTQAASLQRDQAVDNVLQEDEADGRGIFV